MRRYTMNGAAHSVAAAGIALATLVVTLGFAATMAWAANLQFNQANVSITSQGQLVCTFKLTGLGDNGEAEVTCSADAAATYACVNKGGNKPQAANKEDVFTGVNASGDFSSNKNGSVTGELSAGPPPTTLDCPGGQALRLCSVSYTNVSLEAEGLSGSATGQTDSVNVSGSLSATPQSCP